MGRRRGVARKSTARRRIFRSITKWDPWVIPLQFKLLQRGMIKRLRTAIDDTVGIEQPTQDELTVKGVLTDQWPYLIGFNKKMLMLYRTFTGETLQNEKQSLINEYVLRGYPLNVLEQLQDVVEAYLGLYAPEFFDGGETGDASKWDAVVGGVYTSVMWPVHHGNRAWTITNFGYTSHLLTVVTGHYYVRGWIYFVGLNGAGNVELLQMDAEAPGGTFFLLYYGKVGANWLLRLFDQDSTWTNGTTLLTVGWHCVQVELENGNNPVNVWLDGNLEITRTMNRWPQNIRSFYLWCYNTPAWPPYHFADCVIGDVRRPTCSYYPHLGV